MDIRPLNDGDREWVARLIVERWGAGGVVGRGRVWNPAELPGFAAFDDGRCVGLVTYELDGEACEIVTLDALEEGRGIGTALLRAAEGAAREAGCARVQLLTTNNNLRALALYQGDLLADDPYQDWPVTAREHLLLAYLDVLDRLSSLSFDRRQYGACVALCRLLVEKDPCREDGHRRLMRCFTRQGQPHLALRQYQACADALDRELGVDPDPATVTLAQRIRHHQPV